MMPAPHHLLLIDDDPILGEQLITLLSQRNYRVTHCLDADSGFRCVQENDIHLLLLDVRLPGMSGLELLAVLRDRFSPARFNAERVRGRRRAHQRATARRG